MAASLAFNNLDSRSSGRWGPEPLTVTPDLSRVAKVARLSDCTLVLYLCSALFPFVLLVVPNSGVLC